MFVKNEYEYCFYGIAHSSRAGYNVGYNVEQESELRFLFEENQRNPETDKGNY